MSEDIPITFFQAFFEVERTKRRFKAEEELRRQSVKDTTPIYGTLLTPDGGDVSGAISSSGGGGADEAAIHVDVANEINLITEKTIIVDTDKLVIEDSEDNHNKKLVQVVNVAAKVIENMIEPVSTGIETKTGTGKGSTLDMSSLSYDRIWVHIIKGATGYTSATILLQVCDNDSAVDAEWETLGTFTLTANETDSINKKWSANFARLNITAFVGDDIKMNLGATV